MKSLPPIILVVLVIFHTSIYAAEGADDYAGLAKKLDKLNGEEVLNEVCSGDWLTLPALSEASPQNRQDIKAIASAVLGSLAQEAKYLPVASDQNNILNGTLRAAAISNIALSRGGYLNDLIAASADRVFLLGAWAIVDDYPKLASKLVPVIQERGKLANPKSWLMARYHLDSELESKKDVIEGFKSDISGFQAAMTLQSQGKDVANVPTVFAQMEEPSVTDLWWEVYIMDFRINAVLRAGIAFVQRGGVLIPEPKDKSSAIEAVFGADGPPYHHELRRGAIRSDDIWTERDAARNTAVRNLQTAQWFGMP